MIASNVHCRNEVVVYHSYKYKDMIINLTSTR